MNDIDTEALRRLAGAATPGPWIAVTDGKEGSAVTFDGGKYPEAITWDDHGGEVFTVPDAEFIAAARTALPALLDENAALRARIDAVRELHYPAHNSQDRTPFCPDCKGAPGVHECGCWRDEQETPVCGHCRGWKGVGPVEWPCPTIRALDGTVTPPRA